MRDLTGILNRVRFGRKEDEMEKPKVQNTTYTDHESGEIIIVYWVINADGVKVYTDADGNPK